MAVYSDFTLTQFEDSTLTVSITPPTAIGLWDFNFNVRKRFGSESGLIVKSSASGYGAGQSGISIVDSGQGRVNVRINTQDTSGLEPNFAYAYALNRSNSGSVTVLTTGYFKLLPSVGGAAIVG